VVAQAGAPGAVTIATNMAGRGTDIKLGGNAEQLIEELEEKYVGANDNSPDDDDVGARRDAPVLTREGLEQKKKEIYDRIETDRVKVLNAGGLYVIGTERHESRRIDNQLRGRSGRQGDPGDSKFFLALDDDLMRIFGASRLDGMLTTLGLKTGEAIMHPWITKALEKAQKRVEARYFESRKELLKYDDVMNEHRGVVYKQRNELMTSENLQPFVNDIMSDVVESICESNIPEKSHVEDWNMAGIHDAMVGIFGIDITDLDEWKKDENISEHKAYDGLMRLAKNRYEYQRERYGDELMKQAERQMALQALDTNWRKHLANMDYLQTGIGLRGYAQKNPLYEYKREAFELFRGMMMNFKTMALTYVCRLEMSREEVDDMKAEHDARDAALNAADAGGARSPGAPSGVSRNDLCPCGSGLKYKHCHGKLK